MKNKIKLLDEETIQQIAAGEIIDNPASIVKELIENSLDARANSIVIEIKNGGKDLIRVTDNGIGISEDNLELAFKRHSTSKLYNSDDLYNIKSLGFRGEALASISSVSRVNIITKTYENMAAIEANVENGNIVKKNIVGAPNGTTIISKDLFYNLPVRKQFLKSDRIEANRINKIIFKIALGNPETSFKFISNNEVKLNILKTTNIEDHVYNLLGEKISRNLNYFELIEKDIKIKCLLSNNKLYRGNRSHQYIYVNGRSVQNSNIRRVIEDKYKTIVPSNRFPIFIIFIEIDPGKIDVNIHPNKEEVRFTDDKHIAELFSNILTKARRSFLSIPNLVLNNRKKDTTNKIVDTPNLFKEDNSSYNKSIINNETHKYINNNDQSKGVSFKKNNYINSNLETSITEDSKDSFEEINKVDNIEFIKIIFETYILALNKNKKIFYIIDQHAAHERVMYEKYLKEFKNEKILIQETLTPSILNLTNFELEKYKNNKILFEKLGFIVDYFGGNSIVIRGFPLLFGKPNTEQLFLDMLDTLDFKNITNIYDLKTEKIMKIACVQAVKSGDKLDVLEINSLINQLMECKHPYSCPHGRPTILKMTKKDIEKEFLRII